MASGNFSVELVVPDIGALGSPGAAWWMLLAWTCFVAAAVHGCAKLHRSAQPGQPSPRPAAPPSPLQSKTSDLGARAGAVNPPLHMNQLGTYYHFNASCEHMRKHSKKEPRQLLCCPQCATQASLVLTAE